MSKESEWPSRFGTLGEKVFGKDSEFNKPTRKISRAIDNYPTDEMAPTRSPVTGKYYTSKKALRAEYRAYGMEEVGTAYDNGYSPEKERDRKTADLVRSLRDKVIERYNDGKLRGY